MEQQSRHTVNQHHMQDWLVLHDIQADKVIDLLATNPNSGPQAKHTTPDTTHIHAQQAWALAAAALRSLWPTHSQLITDTEQHCVTYFEQPCDAPHTLDKGSDHYPEVYLYYHGTGSDLLTMAHEFGHALQIVANQSHFIPPVLRELAAFISELALIQYLDHQQPELAANLETAQQDDNSRYLGTDLINLQQALQQDIAQSSPAPYSYCWNYPVARLLAKQLFANLDPDSLWQIINGDWSLQQCLTASAAKISEPPPNLRLHNYLPPISAFDKQHPAINGYRCLGMAALLDMDYWQGLAEQTIANYVALITRHLQSQTLLVATNQSQQPIGYITWATDNDQKQNTNLAHQCAPFGDYLALQTQLKQHLSGSNMPVHAHHPGSARQEQLAWQS